MELGVCVCVCVTALVLLFCGCLLPALVESDVG